MPVSRRKNPRIEGSERFAFELRPSRIDGSGMFALASIPARRKLGDLAGELISVSQARRRAKGRTSIAIVELDDGRAIDASIAPNAFRFINHSCSPNAYMRTLGTHVEFYALRTIAAGEEITCDYGETHHEGRRPCTCGSARCRGRI